MTLLTLLTSLLSLYIFLTFFYCFYYRLWTINCLLGKFLRNIVTESTISSELLLNYVMTYCGLFCGNFNWRQDVNLHFNIFINSCARLTLFVYARLTLFVSVFLRVCQNIYLRTFFKMSSRGNIWILPLKRLWEVNARKMKHSEMLFPEL